MLALLATVRKERETSQLLSKWKKSGKQNHVHKRHEALLLLHLIFTEKDEDLMFLNSRSYDPAQFQYFIED